MNHESQWHFITAGFGTMNYRARARQLAREIMSLNFFASATPFTEKNFRELLPEFHLKYRGILKPWIHGFGYYIWKPALIQQCLRELPRGSFLVYLDAGFVIDTTADFQQAFLNIKNHVIKHGVTVFTSSQFLEHEFCSRDLLDFLRVPMEDRHSYQNLGGAVFIQNNTKGNALMEEWVKLTQFENCRFLVPSWFEFPNHPNFVHHAHDQAVLSCLIKTRLTRSATFFESSLPERSGNDSTESHTTAPFIAARYRYATPISSKSFSSLCFWKTVATFSKIRLAICRRLFKRSVRILLDR